MAQDNSLGAWPYQAAKILSTEQSQIATPYLLSSPVLRCSINALFGCRSLRFVMGLPDIESAPPVFHSHKNHKPDSRGGKGGQI